MGPKVKKQVEDLTHGPGKLMKDCLTAKSQNVRLEQIPQGTTGIVQPLDVYGFRFYKNIFQKVTDYVNT
ncbi:unnamed protein product [Allacma fusca]|uniref:Uncharacterized protein n=1 Tax=Allacma fusca TaxID=39272 RepID=A0A8J2K596_9HEXA|nr:unnamed protein product [Allacma fusca]